MDKNCSHNNWNIRVKYDDFLGTYHVVAICESCKLTLERDDIIAVLNKTGKEMFDILVK